MDPRVKPEDPCASTIRVMAGFVYIVTNSKRGTLYIGVTSNLVSGVHSSIAKA